MDFSKWAVVGFKDDTGIGRMTRDIQKVLGVSKHFVAPSERMEGHPLDTERDFLLDEKLDIKSLAGKMQNLEGIFCIERLHWHPVLIPAAREAGLKVVCIPMWEWFRGTDGDWKDADLFLCPNEKAVQVLRSYGYQNSFFAPWPLDLETLPFREITGSAKTFVHNAGLIDHDDRKGTSCVVQAFSRVNNPEIRLILRLQQESSFEPINDRRIDLRVGNLTNPADLYKEGDVAIQPSRMEGLGFMVLEPVCCGMPVITTDAPPMNEYVSQPEMLAKKAVFKQKSFAYKAASIKHAYLTSPKVSSLTKRIEWCSQNDLTEISRQNRHWALSRHDQSRVRPSWENAIKSLP